MESERLVICMMCPLLKDTEDGAICNPKLTLNPSTMDVSTKDMPGYFRGCNCILLDKVKEDYEHCPAGRW